MQLRNGMVDAYKKNTHVQRTNGYVRMLFGIILAREKSTLSQWYDNRILASTFKRGAFTAALWQRICKITLG